MSITKELAFEEINKTQDYYVDELIERLNSEHNDCMKMINFTSPTGTGKTKMMSKLINKLHDCYFVVTTLSKGQLNRQIEKALNTDCKYANFTVYGTAQYKINSKLQADDIISQIPSGKKCIWLRDEGHIRTNKFDELLMSHCWKIINFSATNHGANDIKCNFTHTMMLRTVIQNIGTPAMAISKLMEVKSLHKNVKNYNPCALFRLVSNDNGLLRIVIDLCKKHGLKYINITNEDYDMSDLCKDNNQYDVIINKFKITEGIDIRRAHVLYMDNQPSNDATTIQVIGRCRRNALLYSNDIDILAKKNKKLLNETTKCFVYYNVEKMHISEDEDGELQQAFCDKISCEQLKSGIEVDVNNGKLPNGLTVIELEGQTGKFKINADENTGFNVVNPATNFYNNEIVNLKFDYAVLSDLSKQYMISFDDIKSNKIYHTAQYFDYAAMKWKNQKSKPYYKIMKYTKTNCINNKLSILTENQSNMLYSDVGNYYYCCGDNWENGNEYESYWRVYEEDLEYFYKKYNKIYNDEESAITGTDIMRYNKDTNQWVESSAVSAKVNNYNKFNRFLSNRYQNEINSGKMYCYSGKNIFNFDKKCNSLLGYCVEYYSKYRVYGNQYLRKYIERALRESHAKKNSDGIIVRACMLKYRDMMIRTFGNNVVKVLRTITVSQLVQDKYKDFVQTVVQLGTKTAEYVKSTLYAGVDPIDNIDPNLSIKHIKGLADYITKDTILDIKTTNNITESHIRQVLAYHYLSTKRSDLDVKKVIIFDAVSGRSVEIPITEENIKRNYNRKIS